MRKYHCSRFVCYGDQLYHSDNSQKLNPLKINRFDRANFFFERYCAKSPQLKACIHAVTAGVTPCLPAEFRDHVVVADNATEKLIDFACHKDGDRIACKWLRLVDLLALKDGK